MVGRMIPSIGLMTCIEPTIIAPVLPADAKPWMAPLARCANPTEMLESAFCWNALAGWSPISMTSVVGTISKRSAGQFSPARIASIRSLSPKSTILLSAPISADAMTAPFTAASGAKSPPIASKPIFNIASVFGL